MPNRFKNIFNSRKDLNEETNPPEVLDDYFYKVKIPLYHEKHMEYKSLMRPLITWNEIEKNIFETYTEPKPFSKNQNENRNTC